MKANFMGNRILFWIMIFVIVLNTGAFFTWFFTTRSETPEEVCEVRNSMGCRLLRAELGLSESQTKEAEKIMALFFGQSQPIAMDIRQTRSDIIFRLSEETPDSVLIDSLSERLALLQVELQKINFRQFLALKKLCNPDQIERLSRLYLEIHGCPAQGTGQGYRYQNRHRHGQNRHE